jgi:hypothetical protein
VHARKVRGPEVPAHPSDSCLELEWPLSIEMIALEVIHRMQGSDAAAGFSFVDFTLISAFGFSHDFSIRGPMSILHLKMYHLLNLSKIEIQ